MTTSSSDFRAPKPVVLCILDGWGERTETESNAIAAAQTPVWDRFVGTLPKARLSASGEDVGLPVGQMGNSEVGHMTLGGGRAVLQDLPRINQAIADGSFAVNPSLETFVAALRKSGGTCHLMGLLSPGGVHSHTDHIVALAYHVAKSGIPVKIHAFLDGRDVPPESAVEYVRNFCDAIADINAISMATIAGRYFAMDRDQRWDRVEQAYLAIAEGQGEKAEGPVGVINASYEAGVTDEFILPTVIGDYQGMTDGDGVLFANFRADRAREILGALIDPDFDGFVRSKVIDFAGAVGMVEYSTGLNAFCGSLFPSPVLDNILGQIVAGADMKQLRIAETEKYAHVTFFFSGGREEVYPGEDRILVPSPNVRTYDLKPEMSAPELTDRLIEAIESDTYNLIVVNYANGDMVGHTGKMDAAVKAAEAVDQCLGRLEKAICDAGGAMIVTADHGNCELMVDDGRAFTAHTTNLVPIVLVNSPEWVSALHEGTLADVAPTVLHLLGLDLPTEMTGHTLIDPRAASARATG